MPATNSAFIIPAYNAATLLGAVLSELKLACEKERLEAVPIVVVDDGSTDATGEVARAAGVKILSHPENRGKGAALRTALTWAQNSGIDRIVTLDADGQHPPAEAVRLMKLEAEGDVLVLGVRDLKAAGAPLANQMSNRFSNAVLSLFGGRWLEDTQCGLRRYPVLRTLQLQSPDCGYAFESDIVLRAARRGMPMAFVSTRVIYPPEAERLTYFDSVKDPARIVKRVLWTTFTVPHHRLLRRLTFWALVGGAFVWCVFALAPL